MKILYLANMRMPTERAHGIQVIEMCNAFSEVGLDVTLVTPLIGARKDIFSYYDIAPDAFSWRRVWHINVLRFTKIGYAVQMLTYMLSVAFYVLINPSYDVIYTKDERIVYLLSFFSKKIVWEPHVGSVSFFGRRMIMSSIAIIALTEGVKKDLVTAGADESKMLVAHDAVRLEMFAGVGSKEESRVTLGLPVHETIVMYVGHLFEWKGVYVLADALIELPQCTGYFVGGMTKDVAEMSSLYSQYKNIVFLGNQPRHMIAEYLNAADVLVLPNSAKWKISESYTSPLKLFEYMASRRPIVASDLPSLREVLNENNSILVQPDNAEVLSKVLSEVLLDINLSSSIVKKAYDDVLNNSWKKRAERIKQLLHLVIK